MNPLDFRQWKYVPNTVILPYHNKEEIEEIPDNDFDQIISDEEEINSDSEISEYEVEAAVLVDFEKNILLLSDNWKLISTYLNFSDYLTMRVACRYFYQILKGEDRILHLSKPINWKSFQANPILRILKSFSFVSELILRDVALIKANEALTTNLVHFKSLRSITLIDYNFNVELDEAIFNAMSNVQTLVQLNLSNNKIGCNPLKLALNSYVEPSRSGMARLKLYLNKLPNLTSLDLSANQLFYQFKETLEAVKSLTRLKMLNLSNNNLKGLEGLAGVLFGLKDLKKIDLSKNSLSRDSLQTLNNTFPEVIIKTSKSKKW